MSAGDTAVTVDDNFFCLKADDIDIKFAGNCCGNIEQNVSSTMFPRLRAKKHLLRQLTMLLAKLEKSFEGTFLVARTQKMFP